MDKLLLISLCNQNFHKKEFIDPIVSIISRSGRRCNVISFKDVTPDLISHSDRIIISGTSLKDNEYVKYKDKFKWIKYYKKPILGICAGMQIIGAVFGGKLIKKTEIGLFFENFSKDFLGLFGKREVWHLHNYYVTFDSNWEIFSKGNKIPQAVKHKEKNIYCCLFHPEVRNENVIGRFLELC